jgi:hypothetical protein
VLGAAVVMVGATGLFTVTGPARSMVLIGTMRGGPEDFLSACVTVARALYDLRSLWWPGRRIKCGCA